MSEEKDERDSLSIWLSKRRRTHSEEYESSYFLDMQQVQIMSTSGSSNMRVFPNDAYLLVVNQHSMDGVN